MFLTMGRKALTVGVWNDKMKQVEVTQPKGKHFQSMGRSIKGKIFLYPEEAM
jgi:hypothetical protein